MSIVRFYFGWFEGAVWSNLLASAICAGFVWWRLHKQAAAHHAAHLAAAARHHLAQLEQSQAQHRQLLALSRQNHQELLDRADSHALSLQAHVTATARKGGGL